jgi:hypothetical protein
MIISTEFDPKECQLIISYYGETGEIEFIKKPVPESYLFNWTYSNGATEFRNWDERYIKKTKSKSLSKFRLEELTQSMLTEAEIQKIYSDFNPKNVRDPIVVDNTNRLIFTTNYGCPFAITENDRRMALFDVSSERIKDKEYWNWIYNTLDNAYAGKVIGNFLASIDISNFNTTDIFPSEYMDVIKDESISIEKRFITSTQCAEEWDDWLSCNDVFILYRNWCKMENVEAYSADNAKSFGRRLIVHLRDGLIQRRVLHGSNMYKLNSTL